MFLAERNFGRRDGNAETVRRLLLYAHLAGNVGQRQTDADGIAVCENKHLLVIRIGAKCAEQKKGKRY